MSRFEDCLQFVLRWEGGYSDGKTGASRFDRGGATNQGITQRVYDMWRVKRGLPQQPVQFMGSAERDAIYSDNYWKPARCDDMPEPLDLVMFDSAVNCGVGQATKWLQRALGVKADGVIGPVTLAALKKAGTPQLVAEVLERRLDFYEHLIDKDPNQAVFHRGWTNRMVSLRKETEIV